MPSRPPSCSVWSQQHAPPRMVDTWLALSGRRAVMARYISPDPYGRAKKSPLWAIVDMFPAQSPPPTPVHPSVRDAGLRPHESGTMIGRATKAPPLRSPCGPGAHIAAPISSLSIIRDPGRRALMLAGWGILPSLETVRRERVS